ncbi:MAG: hypothetical protein US89_C0007G0039 [Candidatus Peregrinibacteria bacterium GW2011_GWF2_38_29]|nr:MAG: hypothetical protein US89_C0007G0039 [Candidatus Peregrinibacteria bacterium GW2011_GWF2_38_29]HBB02856.1 hypothetical protein [Candidatus Peregrinibacteria bacterium]
MALIEMEPGNLGPNDCRHSALAFARPESGELHLVRATGAKPESFAKVICGDADGDVRRTIHLGIDDVIRASGDHTIAKFIKIEPAQDDESDIDPSEPCKEELDEIAAEEAESGFSTDADDNDFDAFNVTPDTVSSDLVPDVLKGMSDRSARALKLFLLDPVSEDDALHPNNRTACPVDVNAFGFLKAADNGMTDDEIGDEIDG